MFILHKLLHVIPMQQFANEIVTKVKQFYVFRNFVVKYEMSQFTHFLRQFLLTKILLQGNFGLCATLQVTGDRRHLTHDT